MNKKTGSVVRMLAALLVMGLFIFSENDSAMAAGNLKNLSISPSGILRFDAVDNVYQYQFYASKIYVTNNSYYDSSVIFSPDDLGPQDPKVTTIDVNSLLEKCNVSGTLYCTLLALRKTKNGFEVEKGLFTYDYENPRHMKKVTVTGDVLSVEALDNCSAYVVSVYNDTVQYWKTLTNDANEDYVYLDLKAFGIEKSLESGEYSISVFGKCLDPVTKNIIWQTDKKIIGYHYENPYKITDYSLSTEGIASFSISKATYFSVLYRHQLTGEEIRHDIRAGAAETVFSDGHWSVNVASYLSECGAEAGRWDISIVGIDPDENAKKGTSVSVDGETITLNHAWITDRAYVGTYDVQKNFVNTYTLKQLTMKGVGWQEYSYGYFFNASEKRAAFDTEYSDYKIVDWIPINGNHPASKDLFTMHWYHGNDSLFERPDHSSFHSFYEYYFKYQYTPDDEWYKEHNEQGFVHWLCFTVKPNHPNDRIICNKDTLEYNLFVQNPKYLWGPEDTVRRAYGCLDHIDQHDNYVNVWFKVMNNDPGIRISIPKVSGITSTDGYIKKEKGYQYPVFHNLAVQFFSDTTSVDLTCSNLYTDRFCAYDLTGDVRDDDKYYFCVHIKPNKNTDRTLIDVSKAVNCNLVMDGYEINFVGAQNDALYFSLEKYKPTLTGTAVIKNTPQIYPGDVLELIKTNIPDGHWIQWQVSEDENAENFTDIPNARNATYQVRAGNVGKCIRAKITKDGYKGEVCSNAVLISPSPQLEGGFTYTGGVYAGGTIKAIRDGTLNQIYYAATEAGKQFYYQWQISDDGVTGWTDLVGATTDSYTVKTEDKDKYIQITARADGYLGIVYGPKMQIAKQSNEMKPVSPILSCEDPYTTVTITNAKADQEYIVKENLDPVTETEWESAQSPSSDGSLQFSVTPQKGIWVYTRYKETDTTYAGTKVTNKYIYAGQYNTIKGISLSMHDDWLQPYVEKELSVNILPADYNPEQLPGKKIKWSVEGDGVTLYEDKYCLKELELDTMHQIMLSDPDKYLTIGIKGVDDSLATKITAQLYSGDGKTLWGEDSWTVEVGFPLRKISFGSEVIILPGNGMTLDYQKERKSRFDTPYGEDRMTFEKISGPDTTLGIEIVKGWDGKPNGTVSVNVPENAKYGKYVYNVKIDGKDTPEPSRLIILVPDNKFTVTLVPDNGSGYQQGFLKDKGEEFIFPDRPEAFDIPAGKEFIGWDIDGSFYDAYDSMIVTGNVTAKARWIDHVHHMEYKCAYQPTCTEPGRVEHWHCIFCGRNFYEEAGTQEAYNVSIPATGHGTPEAVIENEILGTCTTARTYDMVMYCSLCKAIISKVHCTEAVTGHLLTNHIASKPATCKEPGNKEYWKCEQCGELFYDALGNEPVAAPEDVIIEKLPHTPGALVKKNETAPTCDSDGGYDEVTVCTVCGQECTNVHKTIAALGHDWGEWTITRQPNFLQKGEKTRVCKRDKNHVETVEIPALSGDGDISGILPGARDQSEISLENPVITEVVEKTITKSAGEKDVKGSAFSLLKARGVSKSKSSIKLSWAKVPCADRYIIYGNKCGRKNRFERIKSVKTTSYTARKRKTGTYYKFIVVAVAKDKSIAVSKSIHVTTDGGKRGNNTGIKLNKKKLILETGKSAKVKAALKSKKKVSIHRNIAWESDNIQVAKVRKGKITAVGKGTCYVYAYAQNGVMAKVKVTVK